MEDKYLSVLIIVLCQVIEYQGNVSKYPGAVFYWPMNNHLNFSQMHDVGDLHVPANLHAVTFKEVHRLGTAASLNGALQWIDVEAASVQQDCLAFTFVSCTSDTAITVAFWIHIRGGRRILATGSYTISNNGRGVLMEYSEEKETLNVFFTGEEKHWQVSVYLPKDTWCHVIASWSDGNDGLRVVVDGKVKTHSANDTQGTSFRSMHATYSNLITIGLPLNMLDSDEYGQFDIAHLVFYYSTLADHQIKRLPYASLEKGNINDYACCKARKTDPCHKDPCSSHKCLSFERRYQCICLKQEHKRCKGEIKEETTVEPIQATLSTKIGNVRIMSIQKKPITPIIAMSNLSASIPAITTRLPSIPAVYQGCQSSPTTSIHDINGCGNKIEQSMGYPMCETGKGMGSRCFYGTCLQINHASGKCICSFRCTNNSKMVCGDDNVTYLNSCVLKLFSCKLKKRIVIVGNGACVDLKRSPLSNASYYWPFNETSTGENGEAVFDLLKKKEAYVRNGVQLTPVPQLGHALVLGGHKQWIDIIGLQDRCILMVKCPKGLSVGFWINFVSGDYILAAGGYAGRKSTTELRGFRLQRDKMTKYHTLEVANGEYKWKIYIEPFPTKRWTYLSFSWKIGSGLRLYLNGELTFTSSKQIQLNTAIKKRNNEGNTIDLMFIGRIDNLQEFNQSGNFSIAHLAIWKEELTEYHFSAAYSAHVKVSKRNYVCCYQETFSNKGNCQECICPMFKSKEIRCNNEVQGTTTSGCEDRLDYCKELKDNQGYCETKDLRYQNLCQETCGRCGGMASSRSGPLQHFSEKTLIFALLGCVGGLVILFGVTVYFWKIYRTRCYPSETKGRDFLM